MKPLPFQFPLRIGTDIVHLPRISRLINRSDYLTRFTRRILDEQEQKDFQTRFKETLQLQGSSPTNAPITAEMTRWLAGRFAAKEAARKAAPGGAASISWKNVVIRAQDGIGNREDASAIPQIVYWPNGNDGNPGQTAQLSISHDGEYAVATVLAFCPPVHDHAKTDRKIKKEKKYKWTEYEELDKEKEDKDREWEKYQMRAQRKRFDARDSPRRRYEKRPEKYERGYGRRTEAQKEEYKRLLYSKEPDLLEW